MKLQSSPYLSRITPLLKRLVAALRERFPYASVLAQDTLSMQYAVSSHGVGAIETSFLTGRGFVARVHNGHGLAEYAFNEISEDALPALVERISAVAESARGEDPVPADEPAHETLNAEYEIDPDQLGTAEIVRRLTAIREKALKTNSQLLDAGARFAWQKAHKLFLSENRELSQSYIWTNGAILALAARGEEIKDYFESFSGLCGSELLSRLESDEAIAKACDTAVALLDSQPIPPGEYDCICDPETTGMIVHEAFGHGVEMDMFVKDRALAKRFMGKRVASDLVNMHDGAAAAKECATFLFDDEGTLAQDTRVIENGILVAGYADAVSAARMGVKPTGNGRRESYERKAYTRMTNTFFEGGRDKLEDMIASIQHGYLLENPNSGMEDPKNWGIQCMVNIAREIRDGKLTGKIFSPIVLTGYVPDLLKSISMMSPTVELGGGGFCGKGYKEWVKVSDGGPYIKARIRLG